MKERLEDLQSRQRIDRAIRALIELTPAEAETIDKETPYCETLTEIRHTLELNAWLEAQQQQDFLAELDASHEPIFPAPEEDHPEGWECGQGTITPLPQPDPKPLPFVERHHPEWELMWCDLASRIRRPGQSDKDAFSTGDGWQYMGTYQLPNEQPVHNFRNRNVSGERCYRNVPTSESYANILLGTYTRKD